MRDVVDGELAALSAYGLALIGRADIDDVHCHETAQPAKSLHQYMLIKVSTCRNSSI